MNTGPNQRAGDIAHLLRDARACVERIGPNGEVVFAAGAVEAIRGVAAPLRQGQPFIAAVANDDRSRVQEALERAQNRDGRVSARYFGRRGGGRGRMVTTDFRREPGGTVVATTRRWSPAEGHAAFMDAVQEAIDRGDPRYAVVLVEIQELHKVAGALGYRRAEEIFESVATKLEGFFDQADRVWPVGRGQLGVLLDSASPERTEAVVGDVERFFAAPVGVAGQEIRLRARVGVSTARPRYVSSEQLLVDAEAAAHRGAQLTAPEAKIFSTSFMEEDRRQLTLAGALGPAIRKGEIKLVFQPIIDLRSRRAYGFEVLSRWTHHDLGFVSPVEFIPLAEELGCIGELDNYVLEAACKELCAWGGESMSLSANVSGRHADDPELVGQVTDTLTRTGFDPGCLRLEVTETAVVKNPEQCRLVLDGLHRAGVAVAMDDFGTGFASFRQLVEMPLDVLKVDRSFVDRICEDQRGQRIVRAIISMAHELGMKVVAEGVETKAQLDLLVELDCDFAQGYYFAKPLPPEQAKTWVGRSVTL